MQLHQPVSRALPYQKALSKKTILTPEEAGQERLGELAFEQWKLQWQGRPVVEQPKDKPGMNHHVLEYKVF